MSVEMWYGVGMVRTTLVLPEPLYEEIRMEAFHKRLSMATIIRMRLEQPKAAGGARAADPILALAGLAPSNEGLLTDNLDADLYGDSN